MISCAVSRGVAPFFFAGENPPVASWVWRNAFISSTLPNCCPSSAACILDSTRSFARISGMASRFCPDFSRPFFTYGLGNAIHDPQVRSAFRGFNRYHPVIPGHHRSFQEIYGIPVAIPGDSLLKNGLSRAGTCPGTARAPPERRGYAHHFKIFFPSMTSSIPMNFFFRACSFRIPARYATHSSFLPCFSIRARIFFRYPIAFA